LFVEYSAKNYSQGLFLKLPIKLSHGTKLEKLGQKALRLNRYQRKIINLKHKESAPTKKGINHLNSLIKEIKNEERSIKNNISHVFKDLRGYEDKFLDTVSDYIIKRENQGTSFMRLEEESLIKSLKETLRSINRKRRLTLSYTKDEFFNMAQAVTDAVLAIKKLEMNTNAFIKDEEKHMVLAVKSFFHYIKSRESDIVNSVNTFETNLTNKEKEEFKKIDHAFTHEILSFRTLVKEIKEYIFECQREDYEQILEEDIRFYNEIISFLNAVKKKEELGINYTVNFERSFVNCKKIRSVGIVANFANRFYCIDCICHCRIS